MIAKTLFTTKLGVSAAALVLLAAAPGFGQRPSAPLVFTQLPADCAAKRQGPAGPLLRSPLADGARIVLARRGSPIRVLTAEFHSACDPDVSFDGSRILFAGKRQAEDNWDIYEMAADGSEVRQITRDLGDCRSPAYQSTLYTLDSPGPWYQITFVSTASGEMNEDGTAPATSLYSAKLDGSAVRRLTFNLSGDMDPFVMPDGRMLYAARQRSTLGHGLAGRVALFGVNIDGADNALFADPRGGRIKQMPCVTTGGLAVFVESDLAAWDGAGRLACVEMRRPLGSYRPLTRESDGRFHSPSPLGDGGILVSRRPANHDATHGIYRYDPSSGELTRLFDDPRYHDVQAKVIVSRETPDGRSSVVTESEPHGKLYCLDVTITDLDQREWMASGTARRLRVLEGMPRNVADRSAYVSPGDLPAARQGSTVDGLPPLVGRRMLGEIDLAEDNSFHVEVPANTPIELQLLDEDGMALRTCSWIWAKNNEPRGCIGCHEDGELTPENVLTDSLRRPSIPLCLPPERRRTVDFRRDVMPIIERKCVGCHGEGQSPPRLDGGLATVEHEDGAYFNRAYESLLEVENADDDTFAGRYVTPGCARTSPLVWHLFGRNTSRPWDGPTATRPAEPIPPGESEPLTDDEKRTLVEWIDLGALWNGIPGEEEPNQMAAP